MKLYKNDIFEKNKFKSIIVILTVIILLFYLLKINIKNYKPSDSNSLNTLIVTIQNLTPEKILSFIRKLFKSLVKDVTKIFFFELNTFLNALKNIDNAAVKLSHIINFSNLSFLKLFDKMKIGISNSLLPIFKSIFKIKGLFKKVAGVLGTMLFTLLSAIMTNSALLGSLVQIISALLVMALPLIVASFFFNLPLGIAMSAVYIAVAVPMVIVALETSKIYKLTSPSQNFKQSSFKTKVKRGLCFHEDTLLQTKRGLKKIKDLKIDDKLKLNNNFITITGLMKLNGDNEEYYELDGILVTKYHPVLYKNRWIYPFNHPNAFKTDIKSEFVYNINTKEKRFQIKDHIFIDWDEVYNENIIRYHNVDYFTSWLNFNTMIKMNDGTFKKIKNININDILHNNNKVIGKINLGNKQMYSYKINKLTVSGCKNLVYYDKNGNLKTTIDAQSNKSPFISEAIQLLTENKLILLQNDLIIGDYDSSIDNLIY